MRTGSGRQGQAGQSELLKMGRPGCLVGKPPRLVPSQSLKAIGIIGALMCPFVRLGVQKPGPLDLARFIGAVRPSIMYQPPQAEFGLYFVADPARKSDDWFYRIGSSWRSISCFLPLHAH